MGERFVVDAIYELYHARKYLEECEAKELEADLEIVKLLLEMTSKQLVYYSRRYKLMVPEKDVYFLDQVGKFSKRCEEEGFRFMDEGQGQGSKKVVPLAGRGPKREDS